MILSNKLTNMSFNNKLKINTSSNAPLGHFGKKMLEYGECYIGEPFWLKNGLSLDDKAKFESYQQLCDNNTTTLEDIIGIAMYEVTTPTEICDKIIDTMVDIMNWYNIK